MVKFIISILSVYILLLAVLPCGDKNDCNGTHIDVVEAGHNEHSGELENCAPFCVCACCGQLTSAIHVAEFNLSVQLLQQEQMTFLVAQEPEKVSYKIWQPPKIS